jgi:hypothetical protein
MSIDPAIFMNWLTAQSGLPGEQLAQSVLQASAIQAMQLIVALVVVGWVLSTWLNGRAISQMSRTQDSMGRANEKFFEADNKKTSLLQNAVDEMRLLRESHDRAALTHQQRIDETARAVKLVDEKTETQLQTALNHMTTLAQAQERQMKETVTDLLGTTANVINAATEAALEKAGRPALEAIKELKQLFEAIGATQQTQLATLKRRHDDELDTLKQHFETQMTLASTQITRTERKILLAINLGRPTNDDIQDTPPPPPAGIPDAGLAELAAAADTRDGAAGTD